MNRWKRFGFLGRQRGAVAIIAAASLVALLAAAAIAVDYGRLTYVHRYHQSVADTAALDASRVICNGTATNLGPVQAAAVASAAGNGFNLDTDHQLATAVGIVATDAAGVRSLSPTTVNNADAVQVTITESNIPRSLLLGSLLAGNTPLTFSATATAADPAFAAIGVGSYLLNIDTSQSPFLNAVLGGLLGTGVNITTVGYQGLADANVTLLELIRADATVGSVQELLDTQMSLSDFYLLVANAVSQRCILCAQILQGLAAQVTGNLSLTLGELLALNLPDPDAALDLRLNTLDLLMLGAQVANGENAVATILGLNLGALANLAVELHIIEPPQTAAGKPGLDNIGQWKTFASTSQVDLDLTLQLLSGLSSVPGLLNLNVKLQVAKADAWLESLGCPQALNPNGTATVGVQPSIAVLCVAAPGTDCSNPATVAANPATVLNVLGLIKIEASAWTSITAPGSAHLTFTGPFDPEADPPIPPPQRVGTPTFEALANALNTLAENLQLKITLLGLGLNLGEITGELLGLLQPVIQALAPVLDGLLRALGISVGGADVWVPTLAGGDPLNDIGRPYPRMVR